MRTIAREIAIETQDPNRMPVITVSGRMQNFPERSKKEWLLSDFMPNAPLIGARLASSLADCTEEKQCQT